MKRKLTLLILDVLWLFADAREGFAKLTPEADSIYPLHTLILEGTM